MKLLERITIVRRVINDFCANYFYKTCIEFLHSLFYSSRCSKLYICTIKGRSVRMFNLHQMSKMHYRWILGMTAKQFHPEIDITLTES